VCFQTHQAGRVKRLLDPATASGSPNRSLTPPLTSRAAAAISARRRRSLRVNQTAAGGNGSDDSSDGEDQNNRSPSPSPPAELLRRPSLAPIVTTPTTTPASAAAAAASVPTAAAAMPLATTTVAGGGTTAGAATTGAGLPWIGILDIFGFEHFETNGFQTFLINTANESIQSTFNHFVFEAELRLFEEEGISLLAASSSSSGKSSAAFGDSDSDSELIGSPSRMPVAVSNNIGSGNSSSSTKKQVSSEFVCPDNQACTEALRRILKAVEGVSREPEPSDVKILRRIGNDLATTTTADKAVKGGAGGAAEPADYFRAGGRRGVKVDAFGIAHFAGEVCYSVNDWVARNTDYLPDGSDALLQGSPSAILKRVTALASVDKKPALTSAASTTTGAAATASALGATAPSTPLPSRPLVAGTNYPMSTTRSVLRARGKFSSFLKKATVADSFMKSMQALMITLRSTQCSFIRCVKPNTSLSPQGLDYPMVCAQLASLGIIQTCEVLKAGLPTRVPHSQLLGTSGVGGAPQSVAKLMLGQPLVVRVALVLKLFNVPADAYRVGKTRLFFKAGHIAAIRNMLGGKLPLSDADAFTAAEDLLKQYKAALALAEEVKQIAIDASVGAVTAAAERRAQVNDALESTRALSHKMAAQAQAAEAFDAKTHLEKAASVQQLVDTAAADERFQDCAPVEVLLGQAREHAKAAVEHAHALSQCLQDASSAQVSFQQELDACTQELAGEGALEDDVTKIEKLASRIDPKQVILH